MLLKLNSKVKLFDYNTYKGVVDDKTLFFDFSKNKVKQLKRIIKINKSEINNILISNYDDEILDVIKASFIEDKKIRIEFIYDRVCELLDKKWDNCSPCKFCNNKCIASINNYMDKEYNGCCYSFKRKRFGKVKKEPCKYLGKDKRCTTSNISCKLFTCNYLREKTTFKTNFDDYLLLKLFFNKKEKLVIKYNFFKSRKEVINKLLEEDHKPYIIYLLGMYFSIDKK